MTKYEKAIYDIVVSSHEHLTVNQVYEKLKGRYPGVVPATVYNNLNKLWSCGFIRKSPLKACRIDTIPFRSTTIWSANSAERFRIFVLKT